MYRKQYGNASVTVPANLVLPPFTLEQSVFPFLFLKGPLIETNHNGTEVYSGRQLQNFIPTFKLKALATAQAW